MLKANMNKLNPGINGYIFLVALIIFILFILLILPNEAERSEKFYNDSPAPDSAFIYSGEDLYQMAEDFGAEGRAYYIRSRFTFDVIWPLAYGFFLWAGIVYFGRKSKITLVRYLVLLPILGVLLDYMENLGASIVMYRFPQETPLLIHIVPFFTLSKWISIGASFVVLTLFILYRGIQFIRLKREKS